MLLEAFGPYCRAQQLTLALQQALIGLQVEQALVVAVVIVLGIKFSNFQVLYPLVLVCVLSGLIASSRLYLNAHKPLEVYLGFVTGFLICWIGFSWIWTY